MPREGFFFELAQSLDHGDVHGEVVGEGELEGLADDGQLGAEVEAVGSLEHLGEKGSAGEVLVDESLVAAVAVDVAVEVV